MVQMVTWVKQGVQITEAVQTATSMLEAAPFLAIVAASHSDVAAQRVVNAIMLAANEQSRQAASVGPLSDDSSTGNKSSKV